ncbi:MAG: chemotaxis protein CheW, partial [Chlorobi bacterium]|nr:chemotaxis protein CheW [Chlorobiota bacterium]
MRNLLVCKLSRYMISVGVENVVEVTRIVAAEKAPGLPSGVVGLCSYDTDVVFVVDLHSMLNVPEETYGPSARMLIVQVDEMYVGIMVDAVLNIFSDAEMDSRNIER